MQYKYMFKNEFLFVRSVMRIIIFVELVMHHSAIRLGQDDDEDTV